MPNRNRDRVLLTRWGLLGGVLAFCLFTLPAHAYIYFPFGIGSRPVVHDGKVYFCQADETLTVLDLADGRVIHRLEQPEGILQTQACDAGLIAGNKKGRKRCQEPFSHTSEIHVKGS